jgi:hypothetical protein
MLGAAALVLGVGATAWAAPQNFEGTALAKFGDELPNIPFYGGGVSTLNGAGGLGHMNSGRLAASRGGLGGQVTILITDPDTAGNSIAAVQIDAEAGTGTLAPISGAIASGSQTLTQNQLPVRGVAKICLLDPSCVSFLQLDLTEITTSGTVGAGVGGLLTVGGGTNTIRISVQGAPWTVKTATVVDHIETTGGNTGFINVTVQGWAHGPASATTSSTADVNGVLQLVTPVQVTTNLSLGTSQKIGGTVSVIMKNVPEPGVLVLLGSAVAGLAVLGRRRMRK